jgi:hypothetical protein
VGGQVGAPPSDGKGEGLIEREGGAPSDFIMQALDSGDQEPRIVRALGERAQTEQVKAVELTGKGHDDVVCTPITPPSLK